MERSMPWWVAMTKPNSENIARANLERQGYVTYLPKYLTKVGKDTKVSLLFPRYILIEGRLQWHSVTGTRGITRLIYGSNGQPAVLQDQVINNFKSREDKKGFIALPEPPKFKPGQQVRIAKSYLDGYIGVYQGMLPNERARVLIEMLGQQCPIIVDEADLTAVAIQQGKDVGSGQV